MKKILAILYAICNGCLISSLLISPGEGWKWYLVIILSINSYDFFMREG